MPRYARKKSGKQVYHIIMRGNNKERIFSNEEDKLKLIDIVTEKKQYKEYILYAYCVMDNHVHMVIKEGKDPVARIVKRIAASYSYYYNKKYGRIGHVFQERYKSENIEDERYLMAVVRYIHQNPVKVGISNIENYKWSSYRDYIDEGGKITCAEDILGIISNDPKRALKEFIRFNNEYTEENFLDINEEKKTEVEQGNVLDLINIFLEQRGIEINVLKNPAFKREREEIVKLLLGKSNLSQREIAKKLCLSREMVRRIAVSRDLSP